MLKDSPMMWELSAFKLLEDKRSTRGDCGIAPRQLCHFFEIIGPFSLSTEGRNGAQVHLPPLCSRSTYVVYDS